MRPPGRGGTGSRVTVVSGCLRTCQDDLVNGRAPSDLVCHMRLLIAEEAYLWELTKQVTDYYGGGRTITHGPWRAADCQQVLARWFAWGLVDCIAVSWATKVR